MQKLENSIQKIEELYKAKKSFLKKSKSTMLILGFTATLYVYFELLGSRKKYHLSEFEIDIYSLIVGIAVISMILFIPLYKFIADRLMNKITWDLKSSIINNILIKYTADFKVSFKGSLPDDDIKDLSFQKGLLQFCFGDDLIFGKIKGIKFRISELHSVSPFKRNFDGIVAVLIIPKGGTPKKIINENAQIIQKVVGNKLFLLMNGRKKHFEFYIKKDRVNKESLVHDFESFDLLIEKLNEAAIINS